NDASAKSTRAPNCIVRFETDIMPESNGNMASGQAAGSPDLEPILQIGSSAHGEATVRRGEGCARGHIHEARGQSAEWVPGPGAACRFPARPIDACTEAGQDRPRSTEIEGAVMRFMVIVKANRDTEAGVMPSEQE